MVGKIDATAVSVPASYASLPPQAVQHFAFLVLFELLGEQGEMR